LSAKRVLRQRSAFPPSILLRKPALIRDEVEVSGDDAKILGDALNLLLVAVTLDTVQIVKHQSEAKRTPDELKKAKKAVQS